MKLRLIAATAAAMVLAAGNLAAQDTSTEAGKLSYALGYDLGRNASESGEQVDIDTIVQGLQDGFAKEEPTVPVEELRTAVEGMQQRQQARAKAQWDEAAATNQARSETFLAENKAESGVQTLPSGVQYRVMESGNGAKPTQSSTVELQVAGPYPWGQRPEPARPAQAVPAIPLSEIEMPAMREVLAQMQSGAKWEVTLPPDQAYGADPNTPFPPNVAVQFEVKLVSVE